MESNVRKCYDDGVVFVTGGTGFLGKLLLQKLLCQTLVRKIFVLVRCKKDKREEERYAEIFEHKIFETLKEDQPDYLSRIELITGDCVLPNLGISDDNWAKLKKNVNFVFHCAATVRFDQKIRTAANINVRAPMDLLRNAKEFTDLKAFIHVSTAYSNCTRKDIGEVFYETNMSPGNLLQFVDALTDEQLEDFTPKLIGDFPNTYAYTKFICEDLMRTEGAGLPVAIVRPSMVISTCKQPFAGWVDNFYGPIGITYAVGVGLLRTLHGSMHNKADMVPADYVINAMIVAAWKVTQKKKSEHEDVDIYNYVCTPENPVTWKYYMDACVEAAENVPIAATIYKPILIFTEYMWLYKLNIILLHWVPAYIVDFVCSCIGKPKLLVDGYTKLHKFAAAVEYFTYREWNFDNSRTQNLWNTLPDADRKQFPFSMRDFDWDEYIPAYIEGGRTYLIKEPLETIPAGKRKMRLLKTLHNVLKSIFFGVMLFIVYVCFK